MYNVSYNHKKKSLSLPWVLLVGGSICLQFPRPTSALSSYLNSFLTSRELPSLFFVGRQSRGALRGSHMGVARQSRGRCAVVARQYTVALSRTACWLVNSRCAAVTWGVARQSRGRCATVLRNLVAHRLLSGQRCSDGRFPTSSRPQIRPWSFKAQSSPGIANGSSVKITTSKTVVVPRPQNHFVVCFLN